MILIVSLIISSIYLANIYNNKAFEVYIDKGVSPLVLDSYLKEKENIISIDYITRYNQYPMRITSGNSLRFEDLNIKYGKLIDNSNKKEVVIGDRVSNDYFKTDDSVGSDIIIGGRDYKVVGIITDSNEIILPNNESLDELRPEKIVLKVLPEKDIPIYQEVDSIEGELKSRGIIIEDIIVYKESINKYINMAIFLTLIPLMYLVYKIFKGIIDKYQYLSKEHQNQKRKNTFKEYIRSFDRKIIKFIFKILLEGVLIYTIFILFKNISIAPSMIPTNPFSLSAYLNIIQYKLTSWNFHLTNGLQGITYHGFIINILLLVESLILFIILGQRSRSLS